MSTPRDVFATLPATLPAFLAREADVLAFVSVPDKRWRQIHSTHPIERLDREIRQRTDVVGIFPDDAATIRLIGIPLAEQSHGWAVGRACGSEGRSRKMVRNGG